MGEETGSDNRIREVKLQKSYFDVLGLCCSSEIPLIEKTLNPLEGIEKVTVIVPSKTVIVVHDSLIISQLQIVKALNQARLEASIRAYDTEEIVKRWPNPSILACGLLLVVSLFHHYFRPLKWLALAAVAVGLPTIILRSIAALRRCTLDINTLMLIAVGGAIAMKDYSEAAFIVLLFTVAEWLESRASHKATAGMSSLMSMAPQKAVLAETGQVVDSRDVKINTILAVKAGEVIPIDGIVVEGRSEVDERSLTGESFPVPKQAQSLVWAGTLNIDGYISVQTTALAEHSAVAKMARLVEEAQNSRSNTQRLIDSCAKYYTPAVVILAAVIALVPLIAGVHRRKKWFQLALVLLVSACPCALVLSTPVATFCSLLKASRMGLLIKGGDVLEALAKTRVVALDKTGTITRGEFIVVNFRSINDDILLEKLLYWVASIESKSSHPMASALVDYARSNSIEPNPEHVTEFQIHPGEGIYGEIDGREIYVGNRRLATRAACQTAPNMEDIEEGVTVGYVFSDAVPVGIFTISDNCRTGAAEAIRELKSLGIKTAMVTGDSNGAARHTQNQLGHTIDMVHAELLPEDKVRIIEDLKTKEGSTTMVGDGMNDAPALAAADVGISMGISGSAVAMETSHITLMSNDVRKIPKAIRLARRTHRKIITNIIFSVSTKIAIVALAFAGYPLVWAAVLADVGTCLIVILNSMMLLQTRKAKEKKCCGSSHKSHAPKPVCTDHCDGGTHGSQSKCCQSKGVGSLHINGCDQHHKEEEGRAHGHCLSTCEKRTCHNDSPNHSHRSPESIPGATKATDEHLVSVTSEEEHNEHGLCEHSVKHNDHHEHGPCKHSVKHSDHHHHEHGPCKHSVKHSDHHEHGLCEHSVKHTDHHEHGPSELSVKHSECAHKADVLEIGKTKGLCGNQPVEHACLLSQICKNTDKKQVGGCCGSTMEAHSKKDGCSSLEECTEIREEAGCCRSVRKECGIKDGCSSQPTTCMDKRESSGCCSSDRREECCSSSPICMDKREIGKCCSSYRKGYGLKDGCCGGRTLQLPEIIVE